MDPEVIERIESMSEEEVYETAARELENVDDAGKRACAVDAFRSAIGALVEMHPDEAAKVGVEQEATSKMCMRIGRTFETCKPLRMLMDALGWEAIRDAMRQAACERWPALQTARW